MNYTELLRSADGRYFTHKGMPAFGKTFLQTLKYHPDGFATVQDAMGWYHIDTHGRPLTVVRYSRAFGFYCKRAAVAIQNAHFHIDTQGKRAYPESHEWCGNYQENKCAVRLRGGAYTHIDLRGLPLYEPSYAYVGDYKDGVACVRDRNAQYWHIDDTGARLYEGVFLDLGIYHKDIATAKDAEGWVHIDLHGTPLYAHRYAHIEPFYNAYALVQDAEGAKHIIDETGTEILHL